MLGEYFKPKMISTEHGFTDAANTEVRVFVRRYMFLNSVLLGTLQLIVISSGYERHSEEKGEVLYRQKVLQQGVHIENATATGERLFFSLSSSP